VTDHCDRTTLAIPRTPLKMMSPMKPDVRETLHARLRRPPSPSTVPGSLPVLFFGDPATASVATVGINPSLREYLASKGGRELNDHSQRFETLRSLGTADRASLTADNCDTAVRRMMGYFQPGRPWYTGWFQPLVDLLRGMGAGYEEGTAVHLDVVQEATDPTWSDLKKERPAEAEALLAADGPFLRWLLNTYSFRLVVCNGRTPLDCVHRLVVARVRERGETGNLKWSVATADVDGRRLAVVGWNLPLAGQQGTGLGPRGETELGRMLLARVGELTE
jgi:hypothetical protein